MIRTTAGCAAVLAVGVTLVAGCAAGPTHKSDPSSGPGATVVTSNAGPVNATDAAFVTTLSQIGAQNVTMAGLVRARADHTQLTTLVPAIQDHARDVDAMRDWLTHWHAAGTTGTATPTGITSSMLTAMAGMHGAMFDDDWLEHMGANYTLAIAACQDELSHGTNAQARELASDWMYWMRGQLDEMRQWHDAWVHDGRFPPMAGATTSRTPTVTAPSGSGVPHPGSTHMSDMPHQTAPSAAHESHPAMTSHMDPGHVSGSPPMTHPHE